MDLSIFNNQISIYDASYDNKGRIITVSEFMNLGKSSDYNPKIIAYRTLKQSIREEENPLVIDSLNAQAKNIKSSFPAATLSGLFQPKRKRENLVQHSGLICVDIDDHYEVTIDGKKVQHTQSLDHVPAILQQLPWVAYAGHSVGGVGYFALIPLGPIVTPMVTVPGASAPGIQIIGKHDTPPPQSHEWYFECLEQEFLELGIVIDRACRDTTRLRFISYDPDPCVRNPNCENYMGRGNFVSRNERIAQRQEAQRRYEKERARAQAHSNDPDFNYRLVCQLVAKASGRNLWPEYRDWYRAGAALALSFGEKGRELFHALSCSDSRYNHSETDKQYTACMRQGRTEGQVADIRTLLNMFDAAGIRIYDKKS